MMMSSISRALSSLQWIQRRYIFFLLFACVVMYGLLFHDIHGIITASTAALKSYQETPATNPTDAAAAAVAGSDIVDAVVPAPKHPHVDLNLVKGDAPDVLVDEEPMEKDAGTVPPDLVPVDEYIAICLSVKNQAADMVEWLTHHYHHQGIRRFYIMDDGSVPPLSSYDYPGIPRSALTFTYQPREERTLRMQVVFYKWCLERYRDRHMWIAFIDADEFFDTPGNETLREVLETFQDDEKVGALGVNWRTHTSNGLLTRPQSVRKAFTECVVDIGTGKQGTINRHVKSIVKASKGIAPVGNPHKFRLRGGAKTVGENGDEVTTIAFRRPMTRNRVALHHFAVKSKAEYKEKTLRGSGQTNYKNENFWNDVEYNTPHEPCFDMVHYDP